MKRLIVLLLALGFVVAADHRTWAVKAEDKPKDKKDEKKDDKKDDKKETKKDDADKPKGDAKLTEAQKKELKMLSGTFSVTVFERDGKKEPADELKKMKVVQNGAEWTFSLGETNTQGKDTVIPDKTPKEIDSTYTSGSSRGKTVKGIYKVEGDTITYCWADEDGARPTDFATKADSKLTLMVLKRVSEKKPDDKPKDKPKDTDKPKDKPKDTDKPKDKPKEDDKPKDKPKDKDKE